MSCVPQPEVAELRGLSIAKVLGLTEKPTNGAAEQAEGDGTPDASAAPEGAGAAVAEAVEVPADTPAEASA